MIETDYLVVGAGAAGLIFADEVLSHSSASIVLVDRRHQPGGHWNEAYSFVRLHQPSVYYGAGSMELGSRRIETSGPNAGFFQQASGAEITAYFDRLLRERLLPSGRVQFLPLHDYVGDWISQHAVVSLASGERTPVRVRSKIVDTTFYNVTTPATHSRSFEVADGVRVIPPGELPRAVAAGQKYVVIGGGKTGMDTLVWLLEHGVPADALTWVVSRDSWLVDRATLQPGAAGAMRILESQAKRLAASAEADSIDDLYDRLEQAGELLRVDPRVRPTMYHSATVSRGELKLLRQVGNVIRKGHLRRVGKHRMAFAAGESIADANAVYVDCTARGIDWAPTRPVFDGGRITLQFIRDGRMSFSAAAIGFIEATMRDEAAKNQLCRPIPYEERLVTWPRAVLAEIANGGAWARNPAVRAWSRQHRLAGFGQVAGGDSHPKVAALRERIAELRPRAVQNLERLVAEFDGATIARGERAAA